MSDAASAAPSRAAAPRSIALIGLMGVGKSTVGRRLAARLGRPFVDGDEEIERAAGRSVAEIFADLGETEFRAGEARVMRRILTGPPVVLATGGGAVLDPGTRRLLKARAVTVWLRAELAVLAERVARRDTRPLLRGKDPLATLTALADARYPIYAGADLQIDVGAGPHSQAVTKVVQALEAHRLAHPEESW